MRPNTYTVQDLFERDVRYLVPLYQRPYVWDEEHQWAPLWDDVLALLQHQQEQAAEPIWSHFLGAIVLEQEQTAPGELPRFTVIDGQQRLTTLQILLSACASALVGAGADAEADLLRELTLNNPKKAEGEGVFKVWPTNANRSAFTAVMSAEGLPDGHQDDPHNLIDEAFHYFVARATEYLSEDEGDAKLLRVTLCDLLKVVSITLEPDDNAQVIFETLNARGTPLLALDLVKNAVFARATRMGADTDFLYEEVWKPQLDNEYWRVERRQGRLNRPAGELFLVHWLIMKLGAPVPATELFATFRQRILTEETDPDLLVKELCADAAVLRSFDNPEPKTPEAEFFSRLEVLDAGTVLPIVLLLFRSPEVSEAARRRALRILESWLTRRALMRLTTRNYNQLVPRLVSRLKDDLEHADEVLLQSLSGSEGDASRWPEDDEFRDFLETRSVYGTVAQPRLVMAMAAVEASQYSNKTDLVEIPSSLSIEHLMPREWEANWPLDHSAHDGIWETEKAAEDAEEHRQERIDRLGNLTIVTSPLNSSLSNGPWTSKRVALNDHSRLLINARLAEREKWDEEAIDERGRWLAEQLIEVWPGAEGFAKMAT